MTNTQYPEFCPTQGGVYSAYLPQCLLDGEWVDIRLRHGEEFGVPLPMSCRGVTETIGLCGYEQAMALAWEWAALEAAQGRPGQSVRVQEFRVFYDIKAKRITE